MLPADLIPWRAPGAFPFGAARLRVHWTNPLTKGMAGLWLLGRGGAPVNLVTGEVATAFNTPLHAPGIAGPAWTNNGSQHGWEVKNGSILSGRTEWTIAAVVAIPSGASTSGSGRALYCERAASGNDITKLDFGPNNTTNVACVWRNTAGNLINPSPSGDSRNSRQSVFSASLSWAPNTTTIRNYIGGGLSRTDTVGASNTTQSNASKRCTIGYDFAATASTNVVGDIALVAVFEPEWAAERHALFARDPWALLVQDAPIVIGRPSAAASSITGTASGTLDLTGTAAGTVLVQAAASGSLGLTGSAAGTVLVAGAATGTLDVTGVAAGTVLVAGAASGGLGLTGSAAGTVRVAGAASGTLGLTGTAAGVVGDVIIGTASGTLDLTGTAAGTVHVAATASGSLGLTGSAAGTVVTPDQVTASAIGVLGLTGIAIGKVRTASLAATDRPAHTPAAARGGAGRATDRLAGSPASAR